jgi:hypothetical protein
MSEKKLYLAPGLIEIFFTTRQVLCVSQDQDFNSPTFDGEDDEPIF